MNSKNEVFTELLKSGAAEKYVYKTFLKLLDIIACGMASHLNEGIEQVLSVSDEIFLRKLTVFLRGIETDSDFGYDLIEKLDVENAKHDDYAERLLMAINHADSTRTINILTNLTRAYTKGMMDLSIYWKYVKALNICTLEDFDLLDKYAISRSAYFSRSATVGTYNLIACGFMCHINGEIDISPYVFTKYAFYFRQFGLHFEEIFLTWKGEKITSKDMELLLPYYQISVELIISRRGIQYGAKLRTGNNPF